jgi:hypothetical protein
VLIGGKGHQYHDGHEGTNSSWAEAKIVDYRPGPGHLVVSSDATSAYRLVNKDVTLVVRTLVFVKPDILILIDRVRLAGNPLPVQIRYQVYDDDGKGTVTAEGSRFQILRPGATLHASANSQGKLLARTGTLNVPAEYDVHPYAEVESGSGLDHLVITLCTAQAVGKEHGTLKVQPTGKVWTVQGTHNGRAIDVSIDTATDIPKIVVKS